MRRDREGIGVDDQWQVKRPPRTGAGAATRRPDRACSFRPTSLGIRLPQTQLPCRRSIQCPRVG